MDDFLSGLAKKVARNSTALDIFRRLYSPPPEMPPGPAGAPLQTKVGRHLRGPCECACRCAWLGGASMHAGTPRVGIAGGLGALASPC